MHRHLPTIESYLATSINLGRAEYVKKIVESRQISDTVLINHLLNIESWIRMHRDSVSVRAYPPDDIYLGVKEIAKYLRELLGGQT